MIEPIIPAKLHGCCIQMTSRDDAFEVSGIIVFTFDSPTSNTQLLDDLLPAAVNVSEASRLMVLPDTIRIHRCGLLSLRSCIFCVSLLQLMIMRKGSVGLIQYLSIQTRLLMTFLRQLTSSLLFLCEMTLKHQYLQSHLLGNESFSSNSSHEDNTLIGGALINYFCIVC